MRKTWLFFYWILVWSTLGCNTRPFDGASSVECVWPKTSFGKDLFAEYIAEYKGRKTDCILAFYHIRENEDTESDIVAPLKAFEVVRERDLGTKNPFGYAEFAVTFQVDLSEATIDETVNEFFDEEGRLHLEEDEDVWLHFVAREEGSPMSTNMLVTAYGWEEFFGTCRVVRF